MVVVIQQTAHTRPAANRPAATGSPERLNQFVADALMVPLTVVVRHEICNRATKMALPQQDHALEALLLDRPHESFRVRVAVRCPQRRLNDSHALLLEERQHGTTPLSIAIADQHATVSQDPVHRIRQAAHGLHHEGFTGDGVEPATWTRRECSSMTKTV